MAQLKILDVIKILCMLFYQYVFFKIFYNTYKDKCSISYVFKKKKILVMKKGNKVRK